jgi:hypothetical protein
VIKRDEIENQSSCFSKARDNERLFVMLARDPAAPVAIRAWIAERIRLGKNTTSDDQIREAFECAALMELERSQIVAERRQEELPLIAVGPGQRHAMLKNLAFAMRQRGSSLLEIEEALTAANSARCQPPVSMAEVIVIAHEDPAAL